MRIVVCIKQVPVVSAMTFDPETRALKRDGVPTEVSAFDIRALLAAIELRTLHGGEVVVLTMGPPQARDALLHCLALGADSAVHLSDRQFAGADTLATAHTLAAALRPRRPDLIFCGKASVDAETGQVGPELAELLDLPQFTCVRSLTVDSVARTVRAEREIDDGMEVAETAWPCLITAAEDIAVERFPSKAERLAGALKPYTILTASDLAPDNSRFGQAGSPTWVDGLVPVASSRQSTMIDAADPAAAGAALAEILVDQHGLFGEWRLPVAIAAEAPSAPNTDVEILVLAEEAHGRLRSVSGELLQRARSLTTGRVTALIIAPRGASLADELAAHGADRVLVADDPRLSPPEAEACAEILSQALARTEAEIVLAPATGLGRDVLPRLAARKGLGLTGDCVDVVIDDQGRLVQLKPAFGGSVVAPILSRTRPQMATIRPGMMPVGATDGRRRAEVEWLSPLSAAPRVRIVEQRRDATGAAALDNAEIVIGIGMGLGAWENFERVRPLVELLGATLATTRDVNDAGWLPKQHQVGITGRAIAPKLYIAIGVRGAFEHTVGLRRAGLIVAINKSPKAPIFKTCDYGVAADYAQVVPTLVAELMRRRIPKAP